MKKKWYEVILDIIKKLMEYKPVEPPPPEEVPPVDAIPIGDVVWLHASPAKFNITGELKSVKVTNRFPEAPNVQWDWNHPNWPPSVGDGVGANMWVIMKWNDGKWYGGTWEWLRVNPKTVNKNTEALSGQPPFIQSKVPPINAWYPTVGEEVGWMISTPCRGGYYGDLKERTPIIVTKWPMPRN